MSSKEFAHLSEAAQRFCRRVVREYVLAPHHRRLLVLGMEASDRCDEARAILAAEGLTVAGRDGTVKAHPAAAVERDSRLACVRIIRELGLSDDATDDSRPPRLRGRYAGRR